jgi:hypothetical protein
MQHCTLDYVAVCSMQHCQCTLDYADVAVCSMDAALPVHIAYDMTDGRLRSEGARAWVTHAVRSEPGLSFGVDGTNLFKPTGARTAAMHHCVSPYHIAVGGESTLVPG